MPIRRWMLWKSREAPGAWNYWLQGKRVIISDIKMVFRCLVAWHREISSQFSFSIACWRQWLLILGVVIALLLSLFFLYQFRLAQADVGQLGKYLQYSIYYTVTYTNLLPLYYYTYSLLREYLRAAHDDGWRVFSYRTFRRRAFLIIMLHWLAF